MKKTLKIFTIALAAFMCFSVGIGQIFEIQSPGIRDVPPGHNPNSSFAFQFKIKNVSGQPFSGPLLTVVEVNGGNTRIIDSTYTSQTGNGNNFTIMVDSFALDTPFFNMGRNGIVVWVLDDNFNPISNTDTAELFLTNQPSFLLGASGLREFNPVVDTSQFYDFKLRVINVNLEDFEDFLYLNLETENQTFRLQSESTVRVKGNKHADFFVRDFKYPSPPFVQGINAMRMWVDGTNGAPSIDTMHVSVELLNGTPTDLAGEALLQSFSVKSPTNGPVIMRFPAGLDVSQIEFFDLSGRSVLKHTTRRPLNLANMPQFSDGLYWINATLSDGSQQQAKLLFVR